MSDKPTPRSGIEVKSLQGLVKVTEDSTQPTMAFFLFKMPGIAIPINFQVEQYVRMSSLSEELQMQIRGYIRRK